jgi:hypothetical protein
VRTIPLRALLLSALLALAGCRGFDLQPPPDFVRLEEPEWSPYALRTTSAHGVVIAVREVENDVEGTLPFWLDAVKERLRAVRGYALLDERALAAASGEEGRLLRFGREEGSTAYVYWVGLWVTSSRVFVVEAGGKREQFEPVAAEVEQALKGFRVGLL